MATTIKGSVFHDGKTYVAGQEKELDAALKASKSKDGKDHDFSAASKKSLADKGVLVDDTKGPEITSDDATIAASRQRHIHEAKGDEVPSRPLVGKQSEMVTRDVALADGTADENGAASVKGAKEPVEPEQEKSAKAAPAKGK